MTFSPRFLSVALAGASCSLTARADVGPKTNAPTFCTCCFTCLNATALLSEELFTSGIARETSNPRTINTNNL